MGEIDTKSIKSVQTALTLFEENCEQRKKLVGGTNLQKDMEGLLNDLATYKLQLETNYSTHQQSLLNLEKKVDKLEADNDKYIAKCRQATIQIDHLESQIIQLSNALIALETAKENAILIEKQVSDLNEALLIAKRAAEANQKINLYQESRVEALEKENHKQRVELENANQRVNQLIYEKISLESELDGFSEKMSKAGAKQKINLYQESRVEALEKENHEQRVELENANQRVNQLICEKISLESELDGFNEKMSEAEAKQKINLYQESRVEALEKENHEQRVELENANQRVNQLICEKISLESELDGFSEKMSEAEAKQKINLYQESRIEALEKENHEHRVELDNTNQLVNQLICEKMLLESELDGFSEKQSEAEAKQKINLYQESRIEALEKENHEQRVELENANQRVNQLICEKMSVESELDGFSENVSEAEASKAREDEDRIVKMKKELEMAIGKAGELRSRAEQAASRAEAAETAKAAVEGQLRRFRERKQRKKAALAELREDCVPKKYESPTTHQPLSKILNMKF